jgi:uncharacterized protein
MSLQFEWDEQKADLNTIKHEISFEEAKTVFTDLGSITIDDLEHSIEEDRYIDIGISDLGRLLVVVYTERGDSIRIISSRCATNREIKFMSKANYTPAQLDEDDMLPEYDFSKGVRGEHYKAYQQGHSVTITHQDGTTTTQEFPPSRIITNLTAENYIALPQNIIDEIEPTKSFDVKVEDGKIILTPVSIS